MENMVDKQSLELLSHFVNQHKLNILLDNGVYLSVLEKPLPISANVFIRIA